MKMAKASEADLKMAMDLANALESLVKWEAFPDALRPDENDPAVFDIDDGKHCREVMEYLLKLTKSASLFRVVFGMAVVLDPRTEVVDPDADTLEAHPKVAAAEKDAERYHWLRGGKARTSGSPKPGRIEVMRWDDRSEGTILKGQDLDAAVDAAMPA